MQPADGDRLPVGIVTPEAVLLELETASLGSRSLAFTLDLLVQGATLFMLFFGFGLAAANTDLPSWVAVVVVVFTMFLVVFGYPVATETLFAGRSIGKRALGLRVVTVEGAPVRFRHAAIRAALWFVDFLVVPGGLVAALCVLVSSRDQRLGDLAAGTLVVHDRAATAGSSAVWFGVPWGHEAYAASLDTHHLNDAEYALVREFLLRAPTLTPGARQQLAWRIANPLAVRMGHVPPASVRPEAFLACIAAAFQHRRAGVALPVAPPMAAWPSAGAPPAMGPPLAPPPGGGPWPPHPGSGPAAPPGSGGAGRR